MKELPKLHWSQMTSSTSNIGSVELRISGYGNSELLLVACEALP